MSSVREISFEMLHNNLLNWYSGEPHEHCIDVVTDFSTRGSGIDHILTAYMIACLKRSNILPKDFHIYWIVCGEQVNQGPQKVFLSYKGASEWAHDGPYGSSDEQFLFEPYRICSV